VPFEISPPRYNIGSWKGTTQHIVSVLPEEGESSIASSNARPMPGTRGISSASTVSTSTSCPLEADRACPTLHINTSGSNLRRCVRVDGSAEREDLHVDRVENEQGSTLPTSPVSSEMMSMGKGKAILIVRRVKGPHLAGIVRRGKGGQVENAQTPVTV
jgi:hypothetical protein